MITPERAAEIKRLAEEKAAGKWMQCIHQVMTPAEQKALTTYWRALPAEATIADAFDAFLTGNLGEAG